MKWLGFIGCTLLVVLIVLWVRGRSMKEKPIEKVAPVEVEERVAEEEERIVEAALVPPSLPDSPRSTEAVVSALEMEIRRRLGESVHDALVGEGKMTLIPEGEYGVVYLNPNSSFHLSFKLDYPNAKDRAWAKAEGRTDLGDDIFIHGENVTIGCIPLGNRGIETLFYLVARNEIEDIRVLIAPRDFREGKMDPTVGVSWAGELYGQLREALSGYKKGEEG